MTQNVTVSGDKDTEKFGKSSEKGEDLTKINIRPNYERDSREAGDTY